MNSLNPLLDHVGSLPTKTMKASAHRLHFNLSGLRKRHLATEPTKFLIGNPSLFSARWSNPYLGLTSAMSDRQRPLGVKFNYIAIRYDNTFQRVYNFDMVSSQNHFWSYPDQVGSYCQNKRDRKVRDVLSGASGDNQTIDHEEQDQNQRHTGPDKVASGAKSFIHFLSIAGETK